MESTGSCTLLADNDSIHNDVKSKPASIAPLTAQGLESVAARLPVTTNQKRAIVSSTPSHTADRRNKFDSVPRRNTRIPAYVVKRCCKFENAGIKSHQA